MSTLTRSLGQRRADYCAALAASERARTRGQRREAVATLAAASRRLPLAEAAALAAASVAR